MASDLLDMALGLADSPALCLDGLVAQGVGDGGPHKDQPRVHGPRQFDRH